jgi:hypothetical protein
MKLGLWLLCAIYEALWTAERSYDRVAYREMQNLRDRD